MPPVLKILAIANSGTNAKSVEQRMLRPAILLAVIMPSALQRLDIAFAVSLIDQLEYPISNLKKKTTRDRRWAFCSSIRREDSRRVFGQTKE